MRFEIGGPVALFLGLLSPVIDLIQRHWIPAQVHTGMTMVNESGDYGEGKGQNQDMDPGSKAYREDNKGPVSQVLTTV